MAPCNYMCSMYMRIMLCTVCYCTKQDSQLTARLHQAATDGDVDTIEDLVKNNSTINVNAKGDVSLFSCIVS
jgi:hypothetical protein